METRNEVLENLSNFVKKMSEERPVVEVHPISELVPPKKKRKEILPDGTISYGLKKDGTPRKAPGRKKGAIKAKNEEIIG